MCADGRGRRQLTFGPGDDARPEVSTDGKRIDNTYKNYNESGELTTTTTAVYERIP